MAIVKVQDFMFDAYNIGVLLQQWGDVVSVHDYVTRRVDYVHMVIEFAVKTSTKVVRFCL